MNKHESVEMPDAPYTARTAPRSPLKSAMKTPGAAPRDFGGMMSPTFRHEDDLEKREAATEKVQAKDLVSFGMPLLLTSSTSQLRRKSRLA